MTKNTVTTITAEDALKNSGLSKTYWGKVIIRAEARGKFTEANIKKSAGWQTCACGKQDKLLPRKIGGSPRDMQLNDLGVQFFRSVSDHRFLSAAYYLFDIEVRAVIVLKGALALKSIPTGAHV